MPIDGLSVRGADLLASIVVHDGQDVSCALRSDGPGFFFGGARLLTSAELDAALQEHGAGSTRLPLTTLQGFQQLELDVPTGAVFLSSGWNSHFKADSWAAYLERVLLDTL